MGGLLFFHDGKKLLTAKLGEINDIEHFVDPYSIIYPQNQFILDCIMPTIPLKYKCLSIILIWVIVSHKKMFFVFLLFNREQQTWYWERDGYFRFGMEPKFGP